MTQIGDLVQAVFEAWDCEEIAFAVLRNYEGLPENIGNDLDVLVTDRNRSERVLLDRAKKLGWRLHNRAEFSPLSLFLSDCDRKTQIHIDLFDQLAWRGFEIFSGQEILRSRIRRGSFWVPSPIHEAGLNLVTRLLYQGYAKEKYAPDVSRTFADDPAGSVKALTPPFGPALAEQLAHRAIEGRWESIESSAAALRRALIAHRILGSPLRTVRNLLWDTLRLARRWVQPPGLVVVLLGPDGSGKSTVAPLLLDLLHPTFSREGSRLLHWKPRVFPVHRSGEEVAVQPHGRPPRERLASSSFFAFHLLEFVLGTLLLVRPMLFRNSLVVFDRHYDDFFVDRRRYRLDVPEWFLRIGRRLVRRPDVVIGLDASPELLQSRKQEVSAEECARQRNAYRELVSSLPNGQLVDASRAPEAIAAEVCGIVLDQLAARTAARTGRGVG